MRAISFTKIKVGDLFSFEPGGEYAKIPLIKINFPREKVRFNAISSHGWAHYFQPNQKVFPASKKKQ